MKKLDFLNSGIIRSSLLISFITVFIKIAGYFEKLIIAYNWGTDESADIYNAVFAFIMSLFIFFRELIEPGFLNTFLRIKNTEDESESWKVFFSLLRYLVLVGLGVTFVLFFFPGHIIHVILPGFTGSQLDVSSELLKYMSFACFLLIISNLTYITLTAYKSFGFVALGDLLFKILIIVSLIIFSKNYGLSSILIGITLGTFVKLVIHLIGLRRKFIFSPFLSGNKYMKNIWILTWPILIGIIFSQISSIVDNMFASFLPEGSISALGYSKKIVDLPVVVLPYALSIVIFPYFSELYIEKRIDQLKKILFKTLALISLVFIPVAIFSYLLSDDIVKLIFQRGAFDIESTLLTARPLAIYAIGMPAFAIETVLVVFYFSIGDTKTPIFIGVVCVVINIFFTWWLIDSTGYLAIASSLVISKTLKVILLLFLLKRKISFSG